VWNLNLKIGYVNILGYPVTAVHSHRSSEFRGHLISSIHYRSVGWTHVCHMWWKRHPAGALAWRHFSLCECMMSCRWRFSYVASIAVVIQPLIIQGIHKRMVRYHKYSLLKPHHSFVYALYNNEMDVYRTLWRLALLSSSLRQQSLFGCCKHCNDKLQSYFTVHF
jgi:hypothetical protein